MTYSLLVSQLGYAPADPKRFVIRAPIGTLDAPAVRCIELDSGNELPVEIGDRVELWGMTLWSGSLANVRAPGRYALETDGGIRSQDFEITSGVLLDRTLAATIDSLEARIGGKLGWQDCAFDGRGLESHAIVVIGLLDVIELVPDLDDSLRTRIVTQIRHGARYLRACQREDGSFMNEYYIGRDLTVWTVCGLACVALARTAGFLSSGSDLDSAKRGWEWLFEHAEHGDERKEELQSSRRVFGEYSPWHPPTTPRARDVLLMLRVATDLYRHTNDLVYGKTARELARTLRTEYQVRPGQGPLSGHFRAWPGAESAQLGWEHVGWGFTCGSVLPDDITGLVSLLELFPDLPDAAVWRATLWEYAAGYLIPGSGGTPFGIYPLVESGGELRYFGPAWHGFNGMYGQVARTCSLLAREFGDVTLEQIAHDNLQWVAGVNVGIEVSPGTYRGLSWFHGVGDTTADAWSGIHGSLGNGFSASPQFTLEHLDDVEDAPRYATNEDWLVHSGSWLSGVAHLAAPTRAKVRVTSAGKGIPAAITVTTPFGEVRGRSDSRGIMTVDGLPPMTEGRIDAEDGTTAGTALFSSIAGRRTFAQVELKESLAIRWDEVGPVVVNSSSETAIVEDLLSNGPAVVRTDHEVPAASELRLHASSRDAWRMISARNQWTEVAAERSLPRAHIS